MAKPSIAVASFDTLLHFTFSVGAPKVESEVDCDALEVVVDDWNEGGEEEDDEPDLSSSDFLTIRKDVSLLQDMTCSSFELSGTAIASL